jgi:Tol biopolymer transport system component
VGISLRDVGGDGTSTAARWLPASDRFMYLTKKNELMAYDAAAGSYQLITSDPFNVETETIGDQQSIIFIQKQPDTTSALVKLDVRDNQVTTLLTPQPKGRVIRFHMLSDRTKLVVVLWEDELINVDLFDMNSGERQPLARGLSNFTMQRVWSDPNTFMFFWNILDKNTRQLMKAGWDMYDLAGKRQSQFQGDTTAFTGIYDGPQFFVPFWSPDHRYAVFTGIDPDVFKGLLVMSSDGQQAWQIKEPIWHIDFKHIRWSPDSSKVAFVANIGGEWIGLIYTAQGKLLAKAKMPLSADYLQWTTCDV